MTLNSDLAPVLLRAKPRKELLKTKSLVTIVLATFVFQAGAQDAIKFEAQNAQQPIEIKIVGVNINAGNALYGIFYGYDEENQIRIDHWNNLTRKDYRIITSSGRSMSADISLDSQAARMLTMYLRGASVKCPVTLSVDRDSGRNLKVQAKCDPLAQVNSEVGPG